MRFLVVDDDPEIQLVVRYALEGAGHEVTGVESGAEALAAAASARPDAVVLDVLLPDADGVEVLARLRRTPAGADVPVVFLTGRSEPARVAELRAAGARGVIAKPFDPLSLAEEIERMLADGGDR